MFLSKDYGIYENIEEPGSYAVIRNGALIGSVFYIKARKVFAYQAAGTAKMGEATDLDFAAHAVHQATGEKIRA